jgi:hypothetical protein
MKQMQIEFVGKVFVVVGGMRRCLVCDRVFTPTHASKHATTPCYLKTLYQSKGAPFNAKK